MQANFRNFSLGYEIEKKGITPPLIKQVHGVEIVSLGVGPQSEADGIFTSEVQKKVFVSTADCIPVLLASPEKVMAVHGGWRGVSQGIVKKAIHLFESPPVLWIGPHILKCCFEVKEDLLQIFKKRSPVLSPYLETRDDKIYFDLLKFVLNEEVDRQQISEVFVSAVECTFCSDKKLPSFRRNGVADPYIRTWIQRT